MDTTEPKQETKLYAVERDPRLRLIIPLVIAVGFFMNQLDQTIITTAIPDIAKSLNTTPVRMNLAISAYVLSLAIFIPISGWLADRFGARRIFITSLVVFTGGSAMCGLTNSFALMLLMRILQGIGGAMMTPVGRLILLRSFPRTQLVTAMTYMSVPAIIGPIIGPLLGGLFTTYLSWRWIFYANLPFGIAGILAAWKFVEESRGETKVKFDGFGFLLVGGGLGLLQYGIEEVGHPTLPAFAIALLLIGSASLLVWFWFYARSKSNPVVDPKLFKQKSFRIGSLYGGLSRIGINAVPFMLPLMLQVGFGMTPVQSGLITFTSAIGSISIRPIMSFQLRYLGFRRVLMGSSVLSALFIGGFAFVQPTIPHWLLIIIVIVFGLLRSTQFMATNTLSYAETPSNQLSQATSLGGVVQQLSMSLGVSVSAMFLGIVSQNGRFLTPTQFHEVFLIMALTPLLSLPGYLKLRNDDAKEVSGYKGKA